MSRFYKKTPSHKLDYLNNKSSTINWIVIAGERELSILEDHDLIFDDYDLKIRQLGNK